MIKKKTIALVSNTSWSVYNFRLGLIRHLKKCGFNVVVIAPKDAFTSKLIAEGISYSQIEMSNYGINPIQELKTSLSLFKIYRDIRPDLIFHFTIKPNIYGSIAAACCKIPSILVTTGMGSLFAFKNFFIRWATLILYRVAATLSREVWFLNENDRQLFLNKRVVKKKKTKLLPSEGINTEWFKSRREKNYSGSLKFLFAGRLLYDKGVQQFIDAAKIIKERYPNVKFQLLGFIDQSNPNSVPYKKIEEWQKKNLIKYLGETTDVRSFIEKASCLVFPSFYREGVSRILMEAAALETPIITTDNVGCREVVDHNKNGFIIEPKNVDQLVEALEEFISMDAQDRMVMGKLGRKKIMNEFDETLIFDKYNGAIERVLNVSITPISTPSAHKSPTIS